jgi:Polyketide cyclase / dehydrase and lipid transport
MRAAARHGPSPGPGGPTGHAKGRRATMIRVYTSSVIDTSADAVWAIVRDFNGLPRWTPFVAESRIEGGVPADKVGCVRNFRLKDGGVIREQLLTLSDYDYQCTYSILESPLGVENYVATLKLTPVTDGNRTFAEWSAEFDCPLDREKALAEQIGQGVFQTALSHLKTLVRR